MVQQQRTDIYLFDMFLRYIKNYWVRFCFDKCEFIKIRIGYVGHNIMQNGNTLAQSKFNILKYWKLPESGKSLHYFIGMINLYLRYNPYFDTRLKLLRNI